MKTQWVVLVSALFALAQAERAVNPFMAEKDLNGVTGPLGDAACNVEAVDRANDAQLGTLLDEIMNTTFFSLFKADLNRECPFWRKDDHQPHQVQEEKCGATIEEPTTSMFGSSSTPATANPPAKSACALDTDEHADKMSTPWAEHSDLVTKGPLPDVSLFEATDDCELPAFWLDMCTEIPTTTTEYTNLQVNPERWTGYNGSHVWAAIYKENCFSRTDNLNDMCYEERVLYRLLSGMHSSINIHIALNFFPPKKGKRTSWEINSARYDELFEENPERLKNLHFAFVVTLRALRKATPILYNYSYAAGSLVEDERSQKLVRRLLDTHIMSSCSEVFSAFDESLLFGPTVDTPSTSSTLKHNFKGVFQNISRILDCVSCQKCKLHGKLILLGVGTALKILLLPESMLEGALNREEIVALINTIGKLSQAISGVKTLTKKTWEQRYFDATGKIEKQKIEENRLKQTADMAATKAALEASKKTAEVFAQSSLNPAPLTPLQLDELADVAIGIIDALVVNQAISAEEEESLVLRAMRREPNILILAKRYATRPQKFLKFAVANIEKRTLINNFKRTPDVVVVGAGLAGLTATLNLVDRGAKVLLIDKNKFTGGNSAYASSGVNAAGSVLDDGNSIETYLSDTIASSGRNLSTTDSLASVLCSHSKKAVDWFRSRVELPLDVKGQMGGHSAPRTFRPSTGMAGSEMVFAITKKIKKYAKEHNDQLELEFGSKLVGIESNGEGEVAGVTIQNGDELRTVPTNNLILATGGYSADYEADSILGKYRPDVLTYETTNGLFTTGDGHKVALAAGAALVDMEQVQVHPTAFASNLSSSKEGHSRLVLCAEILRGEGAILLDRFGNRFADELGKRDYLTDKINSVLGNETAVTILLPEAGAKITSKHVPHYMGKGLLTKLDTITDVAHWMNLDKSKLLETLKKYKADAKRGVDDFGKKYFHHANFVDDAGPFYAGRVTPAVHYTLGGISIDTSGRVLKEDGSVFRGLFAAGEVTGGVHGVNRLGGNALTEALVFGQLVSENIDLGFTEKEFPQSTSEAVPIADDSKVESELPTITNSELIQHRVRDNCWIEVGGMVYDFTEFVDEHPGGVETITDNCGEEATEVFDAVHTRPMLEDFDPVAIYSS